MPVGLTPEQNERVREALRLLQPRYKNQTELGKLVGLDQSGVAAMQKAGSVRGTSIEVARATASLWPIPDADFFAWFDGKRPLSSFPPAAPAATERTIVRDDEDSARVRILTAAAARAGASDPGIEQAFTSRLQGGDKLSEEDFVAMAVRFTQRDKGKQVGERVADDDEDEYETPFMKKLRLEREEGERRALAMPLAPGAIVHRPKGEDVPPVGRKKKRR